MKLRKTVAGISALTMVAGMAAYMPSSAFAADEGSYTLGSIPAYVYSPDEKIEVVCRYYEDMPNVPYISLSEYYRYWSGDVLTIEGNGGKYSLTTPLGYEGEIDTDKDTLFSEEYDALTHPTDEISEDSDLTKTFILDGGEELSGDPLPFSIDFSKYDIDLHGEENDIWFPASTLCNIFKGNMLMCKYFNDALYFINDFDYDFNTYSVITTEGGAEIAAKMANGRPEDLVKYNYNELCRIFDCEYGYPGRIPLTDVMAEKGLDGTLSETNDDTRRVKELLLSTDYTSYLAGLYELDEFFWDGGHTVVQQGITLMPEEVMMEAINKINFGAKEMASDMAGSMTASFAAYDAFWEARSERLGEDYTYYRYAEDGDTAMFSFDSFMDCDLTGWNAYYAGEGDRPEDIISMFYECVKMADANPDIKNFIIDISTNSGGLIMVDLYIMALISGQNTTVNDYVRYGVTSTQTYLTDKNLDGKFDEEDEKLKFDLNFGVLESNYSFSAANIMPSDARDAGLLVIGQRSGGGSCSVLNFLTPDGMPIYISSSQSRFANKDGENIDAGIAPDYELVTSFADGSIDCSAAFDFDIISKCFDKFYNDANNALGDVNGDKMVDSSDASDVLGLYSSYQTGGVVVLSNSEKIAADVNKDNSIDSTDATVILTYYSYTSTGGEGDIEAFLKENAS